MKKIPQTIKIGGYIFTIKQISVPSCPLTEQRWDGKCLHAGKQKEIAIDKCLSLLEKWEVLIHEILHRISYIESLNFDEATVKRLGYNLHTILIDNEII